VQEGRSDNVKNNKVKNVKNYYGYCIWLDIIPVQSFVLQLTASREHSFPLLFFVLNSSLLHNYSSPHSVMVQSIDGLLLEEETRLASIIRTTFMLSSSSTRPKHTCFPSKCDATPHVIKNWHPFVSFPLLAMLKSPGVSCLTVKFSSANLLPLYTDSEPVPS